MLKLLFMPFLALALAGCFGSDPRTAIAPRDVGYDVVIPFSPGGGTDLMFQAVKPHLEEALGEELIPKYISGNGGLDGTLAAYQQMHTGRVVLAHALKQLHQYHLDDPAALSLDTMDVYIGWRVPPLISTYTTSKYPDFKALLVDLISGQEITVSDSGVGSGGDIARRAIQKLIPTANLKAVHFKGGSDAIQAVVQGDVDLTLQLSSEQVAMIDQGLLRPLAVLSDEDYHSRGGTFPPLTDFVTILDMPDMTVSFGMAVSKSAPDEIRAAWQAAWAEVDISYAAVQRSAEAFDNDADQAAIRAVLQNEINADTWL